jgi:EpsI family protein
MNSARLAFAVALLACTTVLAHAARTGTPGQWLGASQLPMVIGDWRGGEAPPLDAETVRQLGADGIVNRVYARGADNAEADLYVAYYARQRPGVSIHSPLHCLPGTGWELDAAGSVDVFGRSGTGQARRLIAQKGRSRALVLYWYAVHGRMISSEVASRWYLLGDRLRLSRNDAALVRVVVPIAQSETIAEQRGLSFIQAVLPHLSRLWS